MRRWWIELFLIACGAALGGWLAHVPTTAQIGVLDTSWSLTMLPGLIFIVPLGGVHGFLAGMIWPVIIASNALGYGLLTLVIVWVARRLF
jgi:hypothetical protein